ncbi:hypothetical protein BK011_02470 [Tenericutes bacterium MZ-XQ]|nr:hypothetical protein BK011_02470 [Tenericutes bacterium MZ-XQ]
MIELELREKYNSRQKLLELWGNHIKDYVIRKLKDFGLGTDTFLKVTPIVRVKSIESFIDKALYRPGKNYKKPLDDITDQVGTRFVVLLESDIDIVFNILDKSDHFRVEVDRDYVMDQINYPSLFDYASKHVLIRPLTAYKIDSFTITPDITCEVQIRTLLQHAYAELTHDLLYKPRYCRPESNLYRDVNRCMALLEATDRTFLDTNNKIQENNKMFKNILEKTRNIANELNLNYVENDKLNISILSTIKTIAMNKYETYFKMYESDSTLKKMISSFYSKNKDNYFLNQPIIIFILLSIQTNENTYKKIWDYDPDYLNQILTYRGLTTF